MEIFSAGIEHMPQIVKIEQECISPPWTECSLAGELGSPDAFFAAAAENGEPVGFCIAKIAGDEAELYQIAVTASARRRGTALALMEAMFEWLSGRSISRVFLEVRKSNAPAIALYERCGFTELCERKNYYTAPVEDALILVRDV